jgi:hypothetical protein
LVAVQLFSPPQTSFPPPSTLSICVYTPGRNFAM